MISLSLLLLLAASSAAASTSVPGADEVSVVGVVVAAQPKGSAAVLRSHSQTRVVGVGESAFGGRVAAIGYESVAMDFAGTRVDVRVRAVKGAGATTPAISSAASSAAGSSPLRTAGTPAASSSNTADTSKTMSRDEVQRRIGNEASRILAETAVAPAMTDGKIGGLTLTRLPNGSTLLSDVGLQVGDTLTQINGTPVDGIPTLMGLWNRLQGEKQIQATVLRGGQPVTLTVNLR
jgi:type II secretion system protein C